MSLGLYETRARRKRRVRWAMVKWTVSLALIVAAGVLAYDTGSKLGQQKAIALEQELKKTTDDIALLQKEKGDLEISLEQTRAELASLQARYEQDVPSGPLAEILSLAQNKMRAGIKPGRIAFVLDAVEPQRSCDESPQEKRFLVTTPLSTGGNDSVRFAEGAIVVTAEGESAITSDGRAEAWFDPALPVTLRFADLDGRVVEADGVLPITHSLVTRGREYRFNVVPGPRGFVKVAGDSCAFP